VVVVELEVAATISLNTYGDILGFIHSYDLAASNRAVCSIGKVFPAVLILKGGIIIIQFIP
jgi:hypothetical protein